MFPIPPPERQRGGPRQRGRVPRDALHRGAARWGGDRVGAGRQAGHRALLQAHHHGGAPAHL